MAVVQIIIDRNGDFNLIPGSRDDFSIGDEVILSNVNNTGVALFNWTMFSVPLGSTAVLSSSSSSTTSFTVDKTGTYLVRLQINNDISDEVGIGVKTLNFSYRIPAANEKTQFNHTVAGLNDNGWATAVQDALQRIDDGYLVGGTAKLAATYSAGTTQADSTFNLNSNALGLIVKDASTPISTSLLSIVNNGSTISFLNVSKSGTNIGQSAATSGAPSLFILTGAAHTGLTASTDIQDISINLGQSKQFATGAKTLQRAMLITAPTYTAVGASVITDAATIATSGAPIASTNITITRSSDLFLGGGKTTSGTTLLNTSTIATGSNRAGFAIDDINAASGDRMFSVRTNGTERLAYRFDRFLYNPTGTCGIFLNDAGTLIFNAGGINVASVLTNAITSTTDLQTSIGNSTNRFSDVWARSHLGVEVVVASSATPAFTAANGDYQRNILTANITSWTLTNGRPGQKITISFKQSGAGSFTLGTKPATVLFAGGTFTLTSGSATAQDSVTLRWDNTATAWIEVSRAMNVS